MSNTRRELVLPAAPMLRQPPAQQQGPSRSSYHPFLTYPTASHLPFDQILAPSQQCKEAEQSMTSWLLAKVEEDKRRQEEEKTRQAAFRLEQLKVEQDMLRVSLDGGIPPYLLPIIFAGSGRRGDSQPDATWNQARYYDTQVQQAQPQGQQSQQHLLHMQDYTSPHSGHQRRPLMDSPSTSAGISQSPGFVSSSPISSDRGSSRFASSYISNTGLLQTAQRPRSNTEEFYPQSYLEPGKRIAPVQSPLRQPGHTAQQQEAMPHSTPIQFHYWQPPKPQVNLWRDQLASVPSIKA